MYFDGENESLIAGSELINTLLNHMSISIQKYKIILFSGSSIKIFSL